MEKLNELTSRLIPALCHIYNAKNENNVKMIILYGSVARGTATSESDIDIAVILDSYTEKMHDEMIDMLVDMELEYDKVI